MVALFTEAAAETCKAGVLEKTAAEEAGLGIFTSCHLSLR